MLSQFHKFSHVRTTALQYLINSLLDEALFVFKSDRCLVQAACSLQSSSRSRLADTQEFGKRCYFHVGDDLQTASQFLFVHRINKPKPPDGLFLELLSDSF